MNWFGAGAAEIAWRRSLYGRVVFRFILLVAVELAAQGTVFVWLVERSDRATDWPLTQAFATRHTCARDSSGSRRRHWIAPARLSTSL